MNKKRILLLVTLIVSSLIVACNNSKNTTTPPQQDSNTAQKHTATSNVNGLKIAFVRMDSVLNNYQGYKEMANELEKKAKANQAILAGKEQAIQQEMVAFQKKLQSGGFVNELAAQQEYQRIEKKGQEAQQQAARITEQFVKLQQQYNDSLNNVVSHEIEVFNKERDFDLIINTTQMSTVLYGKPQYDITTDVIEWLNASYKK